MGIDLYYNPMSSPSRAVMMTAKAHGVELNLKFTNLLAGEHLTPAFLKMNPQHAIPTVDDNGFILTESRPIMQYFANAYGKDDSLYPKDPKKRFMVDQRLAFDQGTLYPRFGELYYPIIYAGAKLDGEKVKKLDEALLWLDGFLSKSKYIAGDQMTIADFDYAATLATIDAVGHDFSAHSNIVRYFDVLKDEVAGFTELNQQGADQMGQMAKAAMKKLVG